MNNDQITCPGCKGKGEYMARLNMGRKGCEWRMVTCYRCDGEKTVSVETMEWIAEGKRLRDRRVDQLRSLKEEAARIGLTPEELGRMEWGRMKPYTMDAG